MKGVVFTEFVELVEGTFSPHLMDELFEAVSLKSGGAYTSVGTYDYLEMVALVTELSRRTGVAVPELLRAFGKHLLRQFVIKFPAFFETANAFEFLERVDGYIHVEVKKLYPDAELPRFAVSRSGDDRLEMVYISDRPFEDLAFGLIEGAIEHFGDSVEIDRDTTDAGIRFVLTARCEEPACL